MNLIKLTLKLFNCVPAKEVLQKHKLEAEATIYSPVEASELTLTDKEKKKFLKDGLFLTKEAEYLHKFISAYYKENNLTSAQLNSTFHASWHTIQNTSHQELVLHQMLHYMTTYGTSFTSDFIYYPNEIRDVPKAKNLPIRVIQALSEEIIIDRCLDMLKSGIALQEQTIDDLIAILSKLSYKFANLDDIKNKEALVKLIASTGKYPSSPVEFLRYLLYITTGKSLLIKNKETIDAIKLKKLNVAAHLNNFGYEKCATIFNRFKPLFLAFKSNKDNVASINKISKLSKTHHKPMPLDILNSITSVRFDKTEVEKASGKANPFRKMRVMQALRTRLNGAEDYLYKIRNGKAYVKKASESSESNEKYYKKMYKLIRNSLVNDLKLSLEALYPKVKEEGRKLRVKYPTNIDYGLPTSEKMFMGNFPYGTMITGKNLIAGIYWKNDWGTRDLDLSALSLYGKIGWNTTLKDASSSLSLSGDMTDALSGAAEYLYCKAGSPSPHIVMNNLYSGSNDSKYKIILGSISDKTVKKNYMIKPSEKILEVEHQAQSKQEILGLFLPYKEEEHRFVLCTSSFGNMRVSGNNVNTQNARSALYYQYCKPVKLRKLLEKAGVEFVEEDFDLDLTPQSLTKDTLINLFKN